jgi:hypothetical protein
MDLNFKVVHWKVKLYIILELTIRLKIIFTPQFVEA